MLRVRTFFGATLVALLCGLTEAQVQATPDHVGDVLRYFVPLAAAGMTWYHQDFEGTRQFGISLLAAQGTTELLKHVVHAPRPDGSGHGFPSGHASAVFSAAGFVHQRYGLGEAWPFYAAAAITGYERVRHHHHTAGQAAAGALVGVGSALLFTKPRSVGGHFGVEWERGPRVMYANSW